MKSPLPPPAERAIRAQAGKSGPVGGTWTGGSVDGGVVTWRHRANQRLTLREMSRGLAPGFALQLEIENTKPGGRVALILPDDNSQSEGLDHFQADLAMDGEGWQTITIPAKNFRRTRNPGPLENIRELFFTAHEWGHTADPDRTLRVRNVTVVPEPIKVFPKPSPERIEEIAAMLPDEPGALVPPATDRAFWERAAELPGAKNFVAMARGLARQPTPALTPELYAEFKRSGERGSFEQPYSARGERLGTFVLAECLANDGSFLAVAERELEAILTEETWLMPAHSPWSDPIDLGAATRAWTVALSAQLLRGKLDPALENRVNSELNRRTFAPYLAVVQGGNPNPMVSHFCEGPIFQVDDFQ